jgi:hypothetical protein
VKKFSLNNSPLDTQARHHVPDYMKADQALQRQMARELEARAARPQCPVCDTRLEALLKMNDQCPHCLYIQC